MLAVLTLSSPRARQATDAAWLHQRDQKVAELSQQVDALEQELATVSEDYRTSLHAASEQEVVAALPAQAGLVDVLEYTHFSPARGHNGPTREQRLVAFVLRPGQGQGGEEIERVEMGPSAPVAEAVERWSRTTDARAGEAAGAELRRLIWLPLSPHLAGVNLLLVSPDGPLRRFPLGALPGRNRVIT